MTSSASGTDNQFLPRLGISANSKQIGRSRPRSAASGGHKRACAHREIEGAPRQSNMQLHRVLTHNEMIHNGIPSQIIPTPIAIVIRTPIIAMYSCRSSASAEKKAPDLVRLRQAR